MKRQCFKGKYMKNNWILSLTSSLAALVALTHSTSWANTDRNAQLVQNAKVLKQASPKGKVITILAKNEKIIVKSRERAWYFISQGEMAIDQAGTEPSVVSAPNNNIVSGWVSMLSVRFLAQAKRGGETGLGSLLKSEDNDVLPTVSTGVRGFDDSDLKKSHADFSQIKLLDKYSQSKESALSFAKKGKLVSLTSDNKGE
jgi:hypothetical protein